MFRYRPLTLALLVALAPAGVSARPDDAARLLIQHGQFWQAQEKPERAAEVWNKLLLIDANQADALYGLGLIELRKGNLQQASGYLQRLRSKAPQARQALLLEQDIRLAEPANQALLEQARQLVAESQRERAIAVYNQALGGKPGQGQVGLEVYNNLGYFGGHWAEARRGMERLLAEYPEDPYMALFLAKHMSRQEATRPEGIRFLARLATREDIGGDADESWRMALTWIGAPRKVHQPLFEQFLKSHPDDAEIRALLVKGRKQGEQVATVWRRDPALDRGYKALGKDDLSAAEHEFTTYLKAHPKDPDGLGGLGILRQRQNRLEDAEVLLTSAVKQGGGRAWRAALDDVRYWSLLQRARDSLAQKQATQARQQLEQARRLKPKDPEGLLLLAEVQAQQGELTGAEESYRHVLAQRAQEVRALRGLAQVKVQQGKPDEALRLIERLPQAERDKLGGLGQLRAEQALQRARAAEQRGDTQGMREGLESALRDDPNNAWARFSLARLYVDMGAVEEARSLMDGLLLTRPNDRDALYTSALLSMQLGEWSKAQSTLARIPRDARDADVNRLVSEVDFNQQLQRINELSRSGSKTEARALLGRVESLAEGKPQRLTALASAYATAGDPQRAIVLMRDLLARSPRADVALTLSYAGVLLQAEQDVEVAGILRDLQGSRMSPDERKQYDDLQFLYRVRQAEQLREQGQLAAAYEVLAPALAQRPQDPLALSALARMYAANGNVAKAFELLEPLVKRNANDAGLQVTTAEMAARLHKKRYAETALERALTLAPNDAEVLTRSARVYQALGLSNKAAKLLRKVVAQEQRQQTPSFAASTPASGVPLNPFAGIGSASTGPATIPGPVAFTDTDVIPVPTDSAKRAATLGLGYAAGPSRGVSPTMLPAAAADNPFVVPVKADQLDPRAGMSEAARALDDILQERSAYVVQGLSVRSNNSESGLSKLTDVQAPLEINFPVADNRIALRVTPVSLRAGSVGDDAKLRFGGGIGGAVSELERFSAENPGASLEDLSAKAGDLITGSTGRQKDSGVGLAVAWERPAEGLKADIGVSPLGFLYSTAIGGISLDRPLNSSGTLRYGVGVSRRVVTDSLTSFAGARDARTGLEWGGVTANGVRGQLSYDDGDIGVYGYASAHALLGNNVKSNTRAELGSGIYWYLLSDDSRVLTTGLSLTGIGYENNQNNFTYGNGGYFSPQSYIALGIPLRWAQRTDNLSYALNGSVGVQHFKQDSAPYYPNDKGMQLNMERVAGLLGTPARFSGSSHTGIGYNLSGAAEYRIGSQFFLGGHLGVDNAQDYRQWNGGLYLRYMVEEISTPMALPVSPYQSPYAN